MPEDSDARPYEDPRNPRSPMIPEAKIQSSYRARGCPRRLVEVHIEPEGPEGPEEPRGIPMIGPISGPRRSMPEDLELPRAR